MLTDWWSHLIDDDDDYKSCWWVSLPKLCCYNVDGCDDDDTDYGDVTDDDDVTDEGDCKSFNSFQQPPW